MTRTDYIFLGCDVILKSSVDLGADMLYAFPYYKGGLDVIFDGMNCAYCMAGMILAEVDEYEGFYPPLQPCDLYTVADREKVKERIEKVFGIKVTPEEFVFTHWS